MSDSLLDTSILIRFLRNIPGFQNLLRQLALEDELHISAMTRLEIVRGMRDREHDRTLDLLNSFETVPMTIEIADMAGEFIRSWRGRGVILGDADAIIAASAVHHNLRLITTNSRHFPMLELTVLQADEQGALGPRS
jgi:tRNA(fMet)-specific endonuclease VapC